MTTTRPNNVFFKNMNLKDDSCVLEGRSPLLQHRLVGAAVSWPPLQAELEWATTCPNPGSEAPGSKGTPSLALLSAHQPLPLPRLCPLMWPACAHGVLVLWEP